MFYQGCLFRKLYQKRSIFYILERKEWLLDQKKCGFKQSKNRKYFKGVSPSFLSKNRIFYQQCLFRKLDQKRSFFDILERKEWLLDPKKWSFKKSKSPRFLSKNRIFDQGNVLGKLSHKALFLDVLDRKECFLDHKHSFKNSKNRKFFQGG